MESRLKAMYLLVMLILLKSTTVKILNCFCVAHCVQNLEKVQRCVFGQTGSILREVRFCVLKLAQSSTIVFDGEPLNNLVHCFMKLYTFL